MKTVMTRNGVGIAGRQRREDGITLVELLISISILFVVTSMILFSWFALQGSFTEQARANEARDIVREAMSRLVREVRDASAPGVQAVVTAEADQVSFYTTFNDPGATDGGFGNLMLTTFRHEVGGDGVGRIVRYRDRDATPGDLSDDERTVIADQVVNDGRPTFSYWYYDALGKPVQSTSALPVPPARMQYIHQVDIHLAIDMNGSKRPAPVSVDSVAQIRNARPL